jgi:hypothetical protein
VGLGDQTHSETLVEVFYFESGPTSSASEVINYSSFFMYIVCRLVHCIIDH